MHDDQAPVINHYGRLLIMAVLSFISMYILMYAMVDRPANVYPSFNQFYMAGLMTAPMVIIEIALMTAMYENKRWNAVILAISGIAAVAFFVAIRQQAAIGDTQFLKSMIPHHAGAVQARYRLFTAHAANRFAEQRHDANHANIACHPHGFRGLN